MLFCRGWVNCVRRDVESHFKEQPQLALTVDEAWQIPALLVGPTVDILSLFYAAPWEWQNHELSQLIQFAVVAALGVDEDVTTFVCTNEWMFKNACALCTLNQYYLFKYMIMYVTLYQCSPQHM